jgi:hypothetical protein
LERRALFGVPGKRENTKGYYMSKWLAVFKNKRRRPEHEFWVCKGCEARHEEGHKETPPDGLCSCPKCSDRSGVASAVYRQNYDSIRWEGRAHKNGID